MRSAALAPLDVDAGGGIAAHPCEHDRVQRAVQPSFSTTVQAIPRDAARGCRDRTDSSDHGECRLVAYPLRARPDRQNYGCGDRADSWQVQQLRSPGLHQARVLFTVSGKIVVESAYPLCQAHRLGAGGCCPQCFFAAAPTRDRRDLRRAPGSAGVMSRPWIYTRAVRALLHRNLSALRSSPAQLSRHFVRCKTRLDQAASSASRASVLPRASARGGVVGSTTREPPAAAHR